ncbi:MAG TPA: peptidoglycan editing factor PgeF [Steroidobacteraceae bacterium]|nr:peptidoglycan editing factor PgeF [Steroidobacteraceae bacterium]
MTDLRFIEADWPAPKNVRAVATTRVGGVSGGPYASLNLGAHVGDDAQAVSENRRRVREALALSSEPVWLNQVHGTAVAEAVPHVSPPTADAAFSRSKGQVCVVQTADCLPVLFCDRDGTCVAAAHAGWRGLAGGVLDTALGAMRVAPDRVLAWLGPAIEQEAFEVGPEVREQFIARSADNDQAFKANERGRWQADLYDLARRELARLGVAQVFGGGFRCYADRDRFFSYRRDGKTGRMATMVWMK